MLTYQRETVRKVDPISWPLEFPDDCPPEDAETSDGVFYRIVKSDPPDTQDFVSVFHLNPGRAKKEIEEQRRTECETRGLSVYAEEKDAIDCALQYPKIGNKIARLTLTPVAGVVLHTEGFYESHNTWWNNEKLNPASFCGFVRSLP